MLTTATHNEYDSTTEGVLFVAFELSEKTCLFRSLSLACVHAAFSSTPCESALSARASQSTKHQ
jgi:hypothetical protein